MKPIRTLATAGSLVLQERDGEYVIRVNGTELMSSRRHRSEDAMAAYAKGARSVLIGGLGLGYTLRTVLDTTSAEHVVVAELEQAVVDWNKDVLKHLHRDALSDPRVIVWVGDVLDTPGTFDCVLVDVDNGPLALSAPGNARIYLPEGISQLKAKLAPKGVLVIWSARHDDAFLKRLGKGSLSVRSGPHTLFVARR